VNQPAVLASAKTAQAGILASNKDLSLMEGAIHANNVAQARSILLRHGFTAQELQGATIVLVSQAQSSSGRQTKKPKITLSISIQFKPLKITIGGSGG